VAVWANGLGIGWERLGRRPLGWAGGLSVFSSPCRQDLEAERLGFDVASSLCSGVGGGTRGLGTLCPGAGGRGVGLGGAVARLRIWAIWMYALVMLEP
jgi:hypothetical protein